MNTLRHLLRLASTLSLAALTVCGSAATAEPGPQIRIVTEEMPPYNMTKDGRLTGVSTEVVQAVLKEAGMQGTPIQSMPWARAYDTALNSENVLIYSIVRTPQREKLFKWVGVVAPMQWYLFSRGGRHVPIRSLEEARQYQVAVVKDDAGEQYLTSKGFVIGQNLQLSNKYEFNYEKLKMGRVDFWITDEVNAVYLSREAGDNPNRTLVRSLHLPELSDDELSMAFSVKTPDALVERLRKGLETIRRNGTYDAIQRKWL